MMMTPHKRNARVVLERVFVRKLFWHAERAAVLSPSLAQPALNVQLDIRHNPLPGHPLCMKLELVLTAVCQNGGKEAFHAKINLAGLFKLEDPQQAADPRVIDFCAAQVYPTLRRLFANQTLAGGFQGLLLHDRHLETALHRLFMGTDTPQAGFAKVFGTFPLSEPVTKSAPLEKNSVKRSGPPAILRVMSRRALRSRWLHLVLSIPIWSGLFIGIGWWLAERDHLQSMFGPQITAMVKPDALAPDIPPLQKTDNEVINPPSNPPALSANEPNHSASAQISKLEKDGRDWLSAQPDDAFTVVLSKSASARGLVDQIDDLSVNNPVFLVTLIGGRYAAISGSYPNASEAQRAGAQLTKKFPGLKPEVLRIGKLRTAP